MGHVNFSISVCQSSDGTERLEGESWGLGCLHCTCHHGQVLCAAPDCPPTPCPLPTLTTPPTKCCPSCPHQNTVTTNSSLNSNCLSDDSLKSYGHGETWKVCLAFSNQMSWYLSLPCELNFSEESRHKSCSRRKARYLKICIWVLVCIYCRWERVRAACAVTEGVSNASRWQSVLHSSVTDLFWPRISAAPFVSVSRFPPKIHNPLPSTGGSYFYFRTLLSFFASALDLIF